MFPAWRIVVGAAAVAFAWLPTWSIAGGDDDKKEKVRITTVDGVELNAHFYRCTDLKIKDPPTILMLHAVGENSGKKPWVALAQLLQTKAAVLTFDFRGHGGSKDVDPATFWKPNSMNVRLIKGAAQALQTGKQVIDYREFMPNYYTALINDIAACKAFLDRKNDARGSCNTSSFIIIGAETGATLGAVWVNAEFHRHRVLQNPVLLTEATDPKVEGKDIIACIWLSMASQVGGYNVNVAATLDVAARQNAVPMVFLYGEDDKKGATVAAAATKFVTAKDKDKFPWTAKVPIKGTDLRGAELLTKGLGVDRAIYNYLFGDPKGNNVGVVEAKSREWTEHEFKKTIYRWRQPGSRPELPAGLVPAHNINEPNLVFSDYLRYLK
ncbi:MAG: hypothetical protein NZO58_01845 [Gemmataceae bacterium]|nr:hypothetical protein [Gemmataceae bacterium]